MKNQIDGMSVTAANTPVLTDTDRYFLIPGLGWRSNQGNGAFLRKTARSMATVVPLFSGQGQDHRHVFRAKERDQEIEMMWFPTGTYLLRGVAGVQKG